jgi:hypothetical protein
MAKIKNIARAGAAKTPHIATVHNGMRFVEAKDGQSLLRVGISKTQAAHPLDDSKQIHAPTVEKRIAAHSPPIHPSHTSRQLRGHSFDGNRVLRDATPKGKPKK